MEITEQTARTIVNATQARKLPPGPSRTDLVIAIASVLGDAEPDAPGTSWVDADESANSLLKVDGKLVHAIAPREGAPHATVYASPVGAVEAADVRQQEGWGGFVWYVDTWHVTLVDGTVVTLRSGGDGSRAEDLAEFVREHLLP